MPCFVLHDERNLAIDCSLAAKPAGWREVSSPSGNSVRFTTPRAEPHGAVLSCVAPHSRSGGHMNATGPISSLASSPWSCDNVRRAHVSRPSEYKKAVAEVGFMLNSIEGTWDNLERVN